MAAAESLLSVLVALVVRLARSARTLLYLKNGVLTGLSYGAAMLPCTC
jgi:hypothetical protein